MQQINEIYTKICSTCTSLLGNMLFLGILQDTQNIQKFKAQENATKRTKNSKLKMVPAKRFHKTV